MRTSGGCLTNEPQSQQRHQVQGMGQRRNPDHQLAQYHLDLFDCNPQTHVRMLAK
jgi:hypothetical protein